MSTLLELAFEQIRQLPATEQNEFAEFLLAYLDKWVSTPEEVAALAQAEAEIDCGDVVAGAELDAFWRKLRA